MPRAKRLPPNSELAAMRGGGKSVKEIAREYEVTERAVYLGLRKVGAVKPTNHYRDLVPWRVKRDHDNAYPAQMLRLLGRRFAGEILNPTLERKLRNWLKKLKDGDLVVTYRSDTPPNPASPVGGFALVARKQREIGLTRVEPGVETRHGATPGPTRTEVFDALAI